MTCTAISVISTINETYNFQWNIEDYIQTTRLFQWNVGEGPLYWYRIHWKNSSCPPMACDPDITECTISTTDCVCLPTSEDLSGEVWHMLATSMEHLCERLDCEKCGRQLTKVFESVERYGRPALCCDVEKFMANSIPIVDDWEPVNFCVCPCVNWVDPCDCGDIHVPCDTLRCPSVEQASFSLPLTSPGFQMEELVPQKSLINTKLGPFESNMYLAHNLSKANVLSQFLARHNIKIPTIILLSYNVNNNAWQANLHWTGDEEWSILFELVAVDRPGETDWRFHVFVTRMTNIKQVTRIVIDLLGSNDAEHDWLGISFSYNTRSKATIVRQSATIQYKMAHDGIGLFTGTWLNDPYLNIKVSAKRL